MKEQQSPQDIVQGLQTTADKIRALANAGYDRTEIAKFLGIRYQHVRNVLLRSGIAGGLRREAEAEREPVEVDAAPAPREDTSWKVLVDAGFQLLGEWTHDPESLLRLDAKAPTAPGVYAFVVNDIVVYVGLTLSGLKTRLDQYRRATKARRPARASTGEFHRRCTKARSSRCWWLRPSRPSGARADRVEGSSGQHSCRIGSWSD